MNLTRCPRCDRLVFGYRCGKCHACKKAIASTRLKISADKLQAFIDLKPPISADELVVNSPECINTTRILPMDETNTEFICIECGFLMDENGNRIHVPPGLDQRWQQK